jgi:hypothetical protein
MTNLFYYISPKSRTKKRINQLSEKLNDMYQKFGSFKDLKGLYLYVLIRKDPLHFIHSSFTSFLVEETADAAAVVYRDYKENKKKFYVCCPIQLCPSLLLCCCWKIDPLKSHLYTEYKEKGDIQRPSSSFTSC